VQGQTEEEVMADLQAQMKSFSNRLEKLSGALQLMKQNGLDEDLLIAYLCHNLKVSEKKAQQIINCYEDFYAGIIKKGVADSL
jgi:hypothetical protein